MLPAIVSFIMSARQKFVVGDKKLRMRKILRLDPQTPAQQPQQPSPE